MEYVVQAREKCKSCDGKGEWKLYDKVADPNAERLVNVPCGFCKGGYTYQDVPLVEALRKVRFGRQQVAENVFSEQSMTDVRIEE